jgi:CPA1 family monovalent cation:H+ antiporter
MMTQLLTDRLKAFAKDRLRSIFGERIIELADEIVDHRRQDLADAFDALRRQYPDYVADLEVRFLRQSAVLQETRRYQALFADGLIAQELFEDLKRGVAASDRNADPRPRFDMGLDTRRLIERLDLLGGLDDVQLGRVIKLLRPRFTVPNELIFPAGARGDAVFFIASGAVEVRLPRRHIRLGTGEFFGEMALLTGQPRQADVVALSYCRLLVLRKSDFDRFVATNPDAGAIINQVAEARIAMNREDDAQAAAASM